MFNSTLVGLVLSIIDTCDAGDCFAKPLTDLDFDSDISYATNENSITQENIAIVEAGLTGRLDARFYGANADEFGGAFIFNGGAITDYYYGAFGAGRGEIIEPVAFADTIYTDILGYEIEDALNNQIQMNAYASITGATIETDESKVLTLKALAVYQNDARHYERTNASDAWDLNPIITPEIYISSVLNPASSLTFDADGYLSAATVYLAGQTYRSVAIDAPSSGTEFSAAISNPNDASSATITVDRKDIFGLADDKASNYMAVISWDLSKTFADLGGGVTEDSIYEIDGVMLAGIETGDDALPLGATGINFTGRGQGSYGIFTATTGDVIDASNYNTVLTEFAVVATVDFTGKTVNISSSGTVCQDTTNCLDAVGDGLEFSANNIAYHGNNISGAVAAGALSGRLDARFYGGSAREFGGTFAMLDISKVAIAEGEIKHNSQFYYGVFGSERRVGIKPPLIFNADIIDEMVTGAGNISTDYQSLYAVGEDSKSKEAGVVTRFTLQALSAYQDESKIYSRAPNRAWITADTAQTISLSRLDGGTATLNFDNAGEISSVTADIGTTYDATADRASISTSLDGNNNVLDSNYMASIVWNYQQTAAQTDDSPLLTEEDNHIRGMMLAGIETDNASIPLLNGDASAMS